ncbi:MAG: hypothetical protein U0172_14990 [Nitrospiraceae bacterium]
MKCSRCKGTMVHDHLLDIKETMGPMWIHGWRCVACGNIVDPVIEKHRSERRMVKPTYVPVTVGADADADDEELPDYPPLAA